MRPLIGIDITKVKDQIQDPSDYRSTFAFLRHYGFYNILILFEMLGHGVTCLLTRTYSWIVLWDKEKDQG